MTGPSAVAAGGLGTACMTGPPSPATLPPAAAGAAYPPLLPPCCCCCCTWAVPSGTVATPAGAALGFPGAGTAASCCGLRLRTNAIATRTHTPTNMGIRSDTRSARAASAAASWGRRRLPSSTESGAYAYRAIVEERPSEVTSASSFQRRAVRAGVRLAMASLCRS